MAAGAGTVVRDAALFLFAQTATERAHTRAQEQVCVCISFLYEGNIHSM